MKKALATLATLAALAANAAVNPNTTPELEIEAQKIVVAALEKATDALVAEFHRLRPAPGDFSATAEANMKKAHRAAILADEVDAALDRAEKKLKKLEKKHGKAAPKPAKPARAAGNAEQAKQL